MFPTINLLNIKILSIDLPELLRSMNRGIVVTPNVDHLVKLQKDKEFYEVYRNADWILCDSKIIFLLLKFLKSPVKSVIPGSSLFPLYYTYHKFDNQVKIFLLGGMKNIAAQAMVKINSTVGRSIIVGAHSPSFGFEKNQNECDEIVELINKTGATVLVVGVGAPKQEKWIYKYRKCLPNINLFMALGATIDFEAGNLKRAPAIFQKLYLEWFYRLLKEPRRLWRRYVVEDPIILFDILKQKFGKYKNPFSE